jgi:hypothetical protein
VFLNVVTYMLFSVLLLLSFNIWCIAISAAISKSATTLTTKERTFFIDVEGWGEFTNLPHSYAVVQRGVLSALKSVVCESCQYQKIKVMNSTTTPLYQRSWLSMQEVKNTKDHLKKNYIKQSNVPLLHATLRFSFPFNFKPSNTSLHTFVFATTEYGNVSRKFMVKGDTSGDTRGARNFNTALKLQPSVTIVTPSDWSKAGFMHAGISSERIIVLPHGYNEKNIFQLSMNIRKKTRLLYFPSPSLFINDDKTIVYVHVGSMTFNKGTSC